MWTVKLTSYNGKTYTYTIWGPDKNGKETAVSDAIRFHAEKMGATSLTNGEFIPSNSAQAEFA